MLGQYDQLDFGSAFDGVPHALSQSYEMSDADHSLMDCSQRMPGTQQEQDGETGPLFAPLGSQISQDFQGSLGTQILQDFQGSLGSQILQGSLGSQISQGSLGSQISQGSLGSQILQDFQGSSGSQISQDIQSQVPPLPASQVLPPLDPRNLSVLARATELSHQDFERGLVVRARDGKHGKVISVYTLENMMLRQYNRTRVGAFKFHDREDRAEFMESLLERISRAKGTRRENFGFNVRSYTFAIDGAFVWVIFIGLAALSYNKWHKISTRFRALDVKVPCIHAGTQASLETAADMFEGLTDIEQLTQNEVVCEVDEDALRKVRRNKRQPSSLAQEDESIDGLVVEDEPVKEKHARTIKAKTSEPSANKRAKTSEPSAKQRVKPSKPNAKHSEPVAKKASEPKTYDASVHECLAFLTSVEFPSVEKQHAFLLQHAQTVAHGQIGLYLLSRWPAELYARVVHLRTIVVRVLRERYSIDSGDSLGTASLAFSGRSASTLSCPDLADLACRYHGIPEDSQAVLRLVSEFVDNGRDVPIFALFDTARILIIIVLLFLAVFFS